MQSRNYILKGSRVEGSHEAFERALVGVAERFGATLSVVVREEHERYAMHVSRAKLVQAGKRV